MTDDEARLLAESAPTPPRYANRTHLAVTPDEFILDFGLRRLDQWNAPEMLAHTRVVLNPGAAKRLAMALGRAIKTYEQEHGAIAVDATGAKPRKKE
jgi:hypothetical protein